jgi:hypothetical protein
MVYYSHGIASGFITRSAAKKESTAASRETPGKFIRAGPGRASDALNFSGKNNRNIL